MRILNDFDYIRPIDMQQAAEHLWAGGTLMAGGSDILPQLKTELIDCHNLIDISYNPQISHIEEKEDGLHIGGGVVLADLANHPLILDKVAAIAQAAHNVASPQIRNRGTIAGNILQARRCFYYNQTKSWRDGIKPCYKVGGDICLQISNSPDCKALYYSDLAPALLAFNAKAKVLLPTGEKIIDIADIISEHCKDSLAKTIICEFIIAKADYGDASKFYKYSLRGAIDFAIINFAYCLKEGQVSLYAGAIAPHIIELSQTAQAINEGNRDLMAIHKIALDEMKAKSSLIREVGLSISVKRDSFASIGQMLEDILLHI